MNSLFADLYVEEYYVDIPCVPLDNFYYMEKLFFINKKMNFIPFYQRFFQKIKMKTLSFYKHRNSLEKYGIYKKRIHYFYII